MSNNSGFNPQDKFVNEVHTNTKSNLIEITEDKLENILLKHLNKLNKVKGWLTPFSLFVTILVILLTATFKEFASLEKEVWNAVFVITLIITLIWTIISGYQALKCRKNTTIKFLIKEIKNNVE